MISATGLTGDVAEILVYNTVLTNAQENAVGYYLQSKYGLGSAYAFSAAGTAWTGSVSTVWANAGNWNGTVPGVAGATDATATNTGTALFNANAVTNPTPVVDAGRNLQNITFDNNGGNLTTSLTLGTAGGNALLLTSGGTIQTTSTVANAQTINAPLVLEGDYQFVSNAAVSSATLNFGGGITAGGTTGTVYLTLNGTNTGTNTISGVLANGAGGATLGLTVSSGNWTLSNANTYTGNTAVTGGTLNVGSGSLGNSPILINGGTMNLTGSAGSPSVTISGGLMAAAAGRLAGQYSDFGLWHRHVRRRPRQRHAFDRRHRPRLGRSDSVGHVGGLDQHDGRRDRHLQPAAAEQLCRPRLDAQQFQPVL